jgi:menaquinone-dependent protoporphyrinogen oxidase
VTGPILVAYGTKHGSTGEVADAVAQTLVHFGLAVETLPAARVDDVSQYEAVVVGGALYAGRWHPDALRLLKRYKATLASIPVAVFGMGPKTTEEHEIRQARAQLDTALAKVPEVEPCAVAIFGGVVDPEQLRFPFNRMPASDARDWAAIRGWAVDVAKAFGYGKTASEAVDHRSELQQTHR